MQQGEEAAVVQELSELQKNWKGYSRIRTATASKLAIPEPVHAASLLSASSMGMVHKLGNQQSIMPGQPVPQSINEFLAAQQLVPPTAAAAATAEANDPLFEPTDEQRQKAEEMAMQYSKERMPHILYYLLSAPSRLDAARNALINGTIERVEPVRLTANYVNDVLLCRARPPFEHCAMGDECFMCDLPYVAADGPRDCIQLVLPHQWQEYLATGERPKGLSDLCFMCTCFYYNVQRDLGSANGARNEFQPKFFVEVDVPSGYRSSACRSTPRTSSTNGGLSLWLRHPMKTDFFAAKKQFPVARNYTDGRPRHMVMEEVEGWSEVPSLIYGDGLRVDNLHMVNPATQRVLAFADNSYSLEQALRRFLETHRKALLMREIIPGAMQRMQRETIASMMWFSINKIEEGCRHWIAAMQDESKPVEREGVQYRSKLEAQTVSELRYAFANEVDRLFNEQLSHKLNSLLHQDVEQRKLIEHQGDVLLRKCTCFARESELRRQEDGFLAVADLVFRPFKESLTLFSPTHMTESSSAAAERADYLERNMPEEFFDDARSSRYFVTYFNAQEWLANGEYPPVSPDHFYFYLVLLSLNAAQFVLTELVDNALTHPGDRLTGIMERGGGGDKAVQFKASDWKGQDEYFRELSNINIKLRAYMDARTPVLNVLRERSQAGQSISDSALVADAAFWQHLCPVMQEVHSPEDRKYVYHSASIVVRSTPHGEAFKQLQKWWHSLVNPGVNHDYNTDSSSNPFSLLYGSFYHQQLHAMRVPEQVRPLADANRGPFRLQPHTLHIELQQGITLPLQMLLCDFDETRFWVRNDLGASVASILEAIHFGEWPKTNRLIPTALWNELMAQRRRISVSTHSILLACLLRLYVAHILEQHILRAYQELLAVVVQETAGSASDLTVRDLITKLKNRRFHIRSGFLLQSQPEHLDKTAEPFGTSQMYATARACDIALQTAKECAYQLRLFSWDHLGLVDAFESFQCSPAASDLGMLQEVPMLCGLSPLETYFPHPKICLCEDNLIDFSKKMSEVRFISDQTSKDPYLEATSKGLPVVCQVREMARRTKRTSDENQAYRAHTMQSMACTLLGGYRDSEVRLSVGDAVIIMRWMQQQQQSQQPNDAAYLLGQSLRENSVLHIRNNPSFHTAVNILFPHYHSFEYKHMPNSANFIRERLAAMLQEADEQQIGGGEPDVGSIVRLVCETAEEKFKDKSVEVFRRPRVDFLKHLCRCFKAGCIERYTQLWVQRIRKDGPRAPRPEFGPMPSLEHQNAIIQYVQSVDPKRAALEITNLRRIGVSEPGIAAMGDVFRMFSAHRSDEDMTSAMNQMTTHDLLLSYFFYYMLRYEDTLTLLTLPRHWTEQVDIALRTRYGIARHEPLPMNVVCLYFCSPLVGCGRLTTACVQVDGAGSYGNSFMCMRWDVGSLVCRPKKSNKPAQKKGGAVATGASNNKVAKLAEKYTDSVNNLDKLMRQPDVPEKVLNGQTRKRDDTQRGLFTLIKKQYRRDMRTVFKRPCDKGHCIMVPAYGYIVQTCEVKEKKTIQEHTFCPKRNCGSVTVFHTNMIDANGFSCVVCNAEQRENFRRPSCLACGKLLLAQHGEDIRVEPIVRREPFVPSAIRNGTASGYLIPHGTTNRPRRKQATAAAVDNNGGGGGGAVATPTKKAAQAVVKVNKKRRSDPVALPESTGPRRTAQPADEVDDMVLLYPPPSPMLSSLFECDDLNDSSTTTAHSSSTIDEESSGTASMDGDQHRLYTRYRAGANAARAGRRPADVAAEDERPTWRFYALLDEDEGCMSPCWFCSMCNVPWLEEYQYRITKQELMSLLRNGQTPHEKSRHFLYSIEKI